MPVYVLQCPACGHEFRSMVLEGTRPPQLWECGRCGGLDVAFKEDAPVIEHLWERRGFRAACACCGGAIGTCAPSEPN
jgi:hypothetical protein